TLSGLNTSLNAHKSANPIDHPDGSITLAKLAASAMTSPGGTEANRIAVTDDNGAVGLALTALDALPIGTTIYAAVADGDDYLTDRGYLRCDGSVLLQADYPALFQRVGHIFAPVQRASGVSQSLIGVAYDG